MRVERERGGDLAGERMRADELQRVQMLELVALDLAPHDAFQMRAQGVRPAVWRFVSRTRLTN